MWLQIEKLTNLMKILNKYRRSVRHFYRDQLKVVTMVMTTMTVPLQQKLKRADIP